jgi:hypothetical protein
MRNAQEGGRGAAARATIHDFFGGDEASGGQKKTWMVGLKPTMTTLFGISLGANLPASSPAQHDDRSVAPRRAPGYMNSFSPCRSL